MKIQIKTGLIKSIMQTRGNCQKDFLFKGREISHNHHIAIGDDPACQDCLGLILIL